MELNKIANLGKEYTTHMPMTIKMIQATKGSVLELGSGLFSTPLIHWLCAKDKRWIFTYEDSEPYLEFARKFMSPTHRIRFVDDWETLEIENRWSVALIDHHPNWRAKHAVYLKDRVDFIVIHDTEKTRDGHDPYGFDGIWRYFKYRYTWKDCKPWTTVVSNKRRIP